MISFYFYTHCQDKIGIKLYIKRKKTVYHCAELGGLKPNCGNITFTSNAVLGNSFDLSWARNGVFSFLDPYELFLVLFLCLDWERRIRTLKEATAFPPPLSCHQKQSPLKATLMLGVMPAVLLSQWHWDWLYASGACVMLNKQQKDYFPLEIFLYALVLFTEIKY